MILVCLMILLMLIGIIFLVLGGVKKSKKISMIGIIIFVIIIAFSIGFVIRALYEKNKQEEKALNEVNSDIYNEEMITEHYKNNLQEIPKELTVEEAIKRNFFVFDAVEEKVYNEEKLKMFIENTKLDATDRISDEIIIVIYNINGDPIIYNIGFNENRGYVLATDGTRVDISKTELGTSNNTPEEYLNVVINTNFSKDYYEVTVEDTGVGSNSISLKSNSSKFDDVEIARYIITNEN